MSGPVDATPLLRLDGRVALVTGASSGLGARFARVLAGAGARVVLAARRRDRIEALASTLPGALAVPCDVSRTQDVAALVARVEQSCGGLDVLVNNAGISDAGERADTQSLETFERVIAVNQTGLFDLCRQAAPLLLRSAHGSIVNVASIHGLVAAAPNHMTAYATSKSAVVGLTRELAGQWAAEGLRVNALAPGYFRTEMTAGMLDSERPRAWVERNTPLRRPGDEHELDVALLFLASDASSYVTGVTLPVDGGWTSR